MECIADFELTGMEEGLPDFGGANGADAVGIQSCIAPSLHIGGRRHRSPHTLRHESTAFSTGAEAERPARTDQRHKGASALRPEDASEAELLEAAKGGDERAFAELIGRCVTQVRRRILRIVRNRQDAEDALQDSLLRAYIHLHQFREASSFSSWLHRIAINSAVMVLRKRKVLAVISSDRYEDEVSSWDAWDVPDRQPNPEEVYARQQAMEGLSSAVERLPITLRSVIDKFYDGECSVQETADAIGISLAAAKSRLLRARLMLRVALKEQRLSASDLHYQLRELRNGSARSSARAVPR